MGKNTQKKGNLQRIIFITGILIVFISYASSQKLIPSEFLNSIHDHLILGLFLGLLLFFLLRSNLRNKVLRKEIHTRIKAQQDLLQSHDMMKDIIGHNRGSVVVLDKELKYLFASDGFLNELKVQEKEIIGRHHWEMIPDLPQKWREIHMKALSGEILSCEEDLFKRADGSEEWTRWDCRPWIEANGTIGGIILNMEFITSKKKAELALRKKDQMYQALFQSNQVSILLWDSENLNIIDANSAACQYYGWTHEEIIRKKITDINILSKEDILAEIEKASKEECNHYHFRHRLANDEIRNIEAYDGRIIINNRNLIYSLIFDVTERDIIKKDLLETQERNEALLKANPDIMFILNREGMFLDYHSGNNVPLSISPSFFLNKKISEIYPSELIEITYYHLNRLFQTGQMQTFNYQTLIGNEMRYFVTRLVQMGQDKALIIGSDVTEREKANALIKLQAHAMDAANDGLAILNENLRYVYLNKSHANIFGYKNIDELKDESWRILYNTDELQRFDREIFPLVKNHGYYNGRAVGRKKDGTLFPQSISLTRLDNGGIICTIRDITDHIQSELELINAKNRAEESDRLKSAFLANMSHEIRTPMNGILGFAGLLKETRLSVEEKKDYLNIIEQSGERLLSIINDIVEISKIEAGMAEVKITRTNVGRQLNSIADFFKQEIEKKGLKLVVNDNYPSETILHTDKEKVYAVLINLVKNAIKYCHRGIIEIGYQRRKNFVEFFIKDTGIGIPEDQHGSIFNRFVQADNGNKRAFEGTGLGLAISKAYVEMLGGKIWLKSRPDQGSTFYFTIPGEDTVAEDGLGEILKKEEFQLNEVLIAEDNLLARKLLTKLLEPYCNKIHYAGTGIEAIEICRKNKNLQLILMDIQMPEMDGYEATRKIRKFNQEVIILAQTAFALSFNREEALEAGCNDYISKPIKREILLRTIYKNLCSEEESIQLF